ncbi:FAD-binding oxidoreductase [Gemella sp. GH3]|uniref:NAD(P)/FAD-dependent oxidoreductase n=1 Tax=unclassified Gemella TaxID=2624949 RepID=UPI0015D097FC|nr:MULTISPECIES: FAD-dependent oxidoreductase [unclassified Gemella]MBF0713657.1 FAD-binding oxidoreductase [Gemella sp. GH3.1]NYS50609.1 FAD-binding oxidoreductase [Gemella sp. GH3]
MKVAVVGSGIVGATCAYYLSKENVELTVFDYGVGQATKASAGIISPWFSKRRNKPWYKMARLGADFYLKLVEDLQKDGFSTDFYKQSGVYLLRKDDSKLEELLEIAENRKELSPMIGDLKIISLEEAKLSIPNFNNNGRVLFASGGARIEGERFVNSLLNASKARVIREKVAIELENDKYKIKGETFDKVIIAVGAWAKDILAPLGYAVDVRPQKGQLRDYRITDKNSGNYPVIMPEGELDIIPFEDGIISVGATHENNMGFDLTIDKAKLDDFGLEAQSFLQSLSAAAIINERVGIRAYTSDFSPFYGEILNSNGLYVASGLGSSGLTTGPLIGYELVNIVMNKKTILNVDDYPVSRYIKKL